MKFEESLAKAKNIRDWVHNHINEEEFEYDERVVLALSIFQNALDIYDGILLLLESKMPGPALVLARPLFQFKYNLRGRRDFKLISLMNYTLCTSAFYTDFIPNLFLLFILKSLRPL